MSWNALYDDYDRGTMLVADGDDIIADGLTDKQALAIADGHNQAVRRERRNTVVRIYEDAKRLAIYVAPDMRMLLQAINESEAADVR
jgi:hypothetical protein